MRTIIALVTQQIRRLFLCLFSKNTLFLSIHTRCPKSITLFQVEYILWGRPYFISSIGVKSNAWCFWLFACHYTSYWSWGWGVTYGSHIHTHTSLSHTHTQTDWSKVSISLLIWPQYGNGIYYRNNICDGAFKLSGMVLITWIILHFLCKKAYYNFSTLQKVT